MKYTLKKAAENPFIYSKNNIVAEVNKEFMNLTGYSKSELVGKSLAEISNMLRINSQVYLENIEDEYSLYMFTKDYEPKEVTISCKRLQLEDEKTYFIKEKPNSRIKDILPYVEGFLSDDDIAVAIYSITDAILLNVNNKFLNFCDTPYKEISNSIGRAIEEIITGYKGSDFEKALLKVTKTHKPYYSKKIKYEYFEKGDTYWDVSFFPIYLEGKAKYIINTAYDITEKVLNRKLVEEQKEELQAIIENMSDGVCIVDKEFNYSLLNKGAREFLYKADSIKKVGDSSSHTKYFNSEGKLLKDEEFYPIRILNGERLKHYAVTAHRPDGIYHFNISGSPIYDKGGNITKAIICTRDVTVHVNKNELIKTQKLELDTIIENMSDALAIFDKRGNYKKLNKSCRDMYLLNTEKISNIEDLYRYVKFKDVDGNLISIENSPVKRVLNGEKFSGFKEIIKIKNKVIHIEVNGTPIYDKNGNFIAGILLIHDITDKVKVQENSLIKTQLVLLNNIIENIQVGFVRCSYPDFKIIDINHKAFEDLQQTNVKIASTTSIKGQNYFDIYNADEKVELNTVLQKIKGKKSGSHFSYIKYIASGERVLKVIYQPLFGLNNQIIELMIIEIDISEEVRAKNKMKEMLKMQEEFFANVTHELKTPLNVIFSTNQLMGLYLSNNLFEANKQKVSRSINVVKQNCYRLTKLINNIVDLSKIESRFLKLNLSNENIVRITEDIVQSVSDYIKGRGLTIVFDTNTEEKIIACDPDKIERIILNLISNAIKFSNPEGSIFVNILDKGDVVEIAVIDTGIGIDKKNLENIFERFQQVDKSLSRNTEGSGIGLSLVKSILEMHYGKISVESEVGKGSIFKIELPSRTVEDTKVIGKNNLMKNKIEMINIELSDIYPIR